MSDARTIGDLIVASACFRETVNSVEKAKVLSESRCVRRPLPRSNIAKAAALAYRMACSEELPPTQPARSRALFDRDFAFVRDPRSGYESEKLSALASTGAYHAVALNVRDHAPSEWGGWISRAASFGLAPIPWSRATTLEHVLALRDIATEWNSEGLIVNLEQNEGEPRWSFSGLDVWGALTFLPLSCSIGLSTEPWMPDNFDWAPLVAMGCVALPQSCVLEVPAFTPTTVTVRAATFGFFAPVPSFATYDVPAGTPERADYKWTGRFGIYTLDDISHEEVQLWV